MGKHTEQKHHGGIPSDKSDKSNQERKWVKMLNLDHHSWSNNIKKILPHKKQGEGSESIGGSDDEVSSSGKNIVCNGDVCTVGSSHHEEKASKESSPAKKGRAARIKAKTKEVLKKRVRHKRTSGVNDNDSNPEIQAVSGSASVSEGSMRSEQAAIDKDISVVDSLASDEKCDISEVGESPTEKGKEVGENSKDDSDSSDEEQEQPFPMKLKNIEHLGRSATFHQSKELLDAMDVLSMNKDFFLKVLEDPEASLAQHFRAQQVSGKRKHLDKSRTFPRPNTNANLKENNGKSFNMPKSEVGEKQFKDLRQKIRHVIKESKEERQRIALDSVLDKVPCGHQYSETRKGAVDQLNLESLRSTRKDKKHTVKRSPSLNASMERYCQLLETSFNKGSKHMNPNALKLRSKDHNGSLPQGQRAPPSLGRMSSSPDLSAWLNSQVLDSHSVSPSRSPIRIPLPRKSLIKTTRSFNESNSQLMLSYLEKSGTEEEGEEVGRRDHEEEVTQSQVMGHEEDSGNPEKSIASSEDSHLSQLQDGTIDLFSLTESTADQEEAQDHPPNSSRHVRVKSKDRGHFDYVKDILQLSGYTEDQALGNWQSTDQPVDPSLFEELESCSFQEPDYSESEEGAECNRLLLFDSVNEVLLSTYERSMVYWNSPLTSCSRIHPMPKGYRVLEEVWSQLSWYLNSRANQLESSLDHVILHDLAEDDGWMNLQFEAEGTVLDLENEIFDELLMEVMPS